MEVSLLSLSSESSPDWVFRIFDRRTISIKAKNEQVRKVAAVDLTTNQPFTIEVPEDVSIDNIQVDKGYFASLNVFTARKLNGVPPDSLDFFEVLDVDQSLEDFIKAYWLYPKLIKFELVELEPL